MQRYCHHRRCGSPVPPVARFCPRCGGRVKRGGGAKWFIIPLAIVGGLFFVRAGVSPRTHTRPSEVPAIEMSPSEVRALVERSSRPNGTPFSHTPMHP